MAKARSKKSEERATRKLAIEIARAASDDRAEDVIILDLEGRSPVTDYFIIATGGSDRQRRTIAEDAIELAEQARHPVLSVSGLDEPNWVLVDLVDIVLHVFEPDARRFYDLEMLWGDAPKIRWKRRAATNATQTETDDETA